MGTWRLAECLPVFEFITRTKASDIRVHVEQLAFVDLGSSETCVCVRTIAIATIMIICMQPAISRFNAVVQWQWHQRLRTTMRAQQPPTLPCAYSSALTVVAAAAGTH